MSDATATSGDNRCGSGTPSCKGLGTKTPGPLGQQILSTPLMIGRRTTTTQILNEGITKSSGSTYPNELVALQI